jgi:hypothetical protein
MNKIEALPLTGLFLSLNVKAASAGNERLQMFA